MPDALPDATLSSLSKPGRGTRTALTGCLFKRPDLMALGLKLSCPAGCDGNDHRDSNLSSPNDGDELKNVSKIWPKLTVKKKKF